MAGEVAWSSVMQMLQSTDVAEGIDRVTRQKMGALPMAGAPRLQSWALGCASCVRAYVQDSRNHVVWGLMLLAAVLRLTYLDLVEFRPEHVAQLSLASRAAHGDLPIVGPMSPLGIADPPLASYILAIPLLVSEDPRAAIAFAALLNVFAVGLLYRLCRRYYGGRVALPAAAFMSVSPWAVLFSRRLAPEALIIPLGVALLYALLIGLHDRDRWGWAASVVLLGLTLGATLMAAALGVVFISLLLFFPARVRWLYVLFGLCLVLMLFMPYFHHENITRMADLLGMARSLVGQSPEPALGLSVVRSASDAVSGLRISSLMAPSEAEFGRLAQVAGMPASWLFFACLPALLFAWLQSWGKWKQRASGLVYAVPLIWLCVSLVVLAGQPTLHGYRALALLMAPSFVGMGVLVDKLVDATRGRLLGRIWWMSFLRMAIWLVCLLAVMGGAFTVVYTYGYVALHDASDRYGIPYRHWRRIRSVVARVADQVRTDQMWITGGPPSLGEEETPELLGEALGVGSRVVFVAQNGATAVLLPAERPGLYLFWGQASEVRATVERYGGHEAGLVVRPGGGNAVLMAAPAMPIATLLDTIGHPGLWSFDSGAHVIGYEWPTAARAGDAVPVATYWTFDGLPPDEGAADLRAMHALVDSSGAIIASDVCFGLARREWGSGLVLKQYCPLRVPRDTAPGEYLLVVGLTSVSGQEPSLHVAEDDYVVGAHAVLGSVLVGG